MSEFTVYYVGATQEEALAGLPWDDYGSADDCRRDNGAHPDQIGSEPGDEVWHVYSVTARLDLSTLEQMPETS